MITVRRPTVSDFINDVRSGVSDSDLMRKYDLSEKDLRHLAKKILAARNMPSEDANLEFWPRARATKHDPRRRYQRLQVLGWMPVYDEVDREAGVIVDITEKGLGIAGIDVRVGEIRILYIRAEGLDGIEQFSLDAQCRWVGEDENGFDSRAGFEIIGISNHALSQLRKLIEELTIKGS